MTDKAPDGMQRVSRSSEEARASYNTLSRWYDWVAGPSERPSREAGLALLDVQPGDRVLEVGFGTGHALVALAESVGESGRVVGIDISGGMARVARRRIVDHQVDDRVSLCLADGAQSCFVAGSFDAIFMSFTLELFDTPEIPRVLQQCHERLSSGGRMGIVALVKEKAHQNLPVVLYEWTHRLLPKWVDCRPIYLRRILTANGFTITASERHSMWGLPVDAVIAEPAS